MSYTSPFETPRQLWAWSCARCRSLNVFEASGCAACAASEQLAGCGLGGVPGRVYERSPEDLLLFDSCESGDANVVAEVLARGGVKVDSCDGEGRTPLYVAARNGHREVAGLLVSAGACVFAPRYDGRTPLSVARARGFFDVVMLLEGACRRARPVLLTPSRSELHTEVFISALIVTAQNGFGHDVDPFAALCHETWDEEILFDALKDLPHGRKKRTRLMYAAAVGDVARLRWLLARGAHVENADAHGRTALYWAAAEGRVPTICELLALTMPRVATANVAASSSEGWTPLHAASSGGHVEAVEVLLERGAAVDATTLLGKTPLHLALDANMSKTALALLARGADAGCRDASGTTPLLVACEKGLDEVVRELLSRGAAVDGAAAYRKDKSGSTTPLLAAIQHGHVEVLQQLLARGAATSRFAFVGGFVRESALAHAKACALKASPHNAAVMALLKKRGADPEERHFALFSASGRGDADAVREALLQGAEVDALESNGATPLHAASTPEVVQELLAAGAVLERRDYEGGTALLYASRSGHVAAVSELLARGAAVNAATDQGETSLHAASRSGHAEVVQALLSGGAGVELYDSEGRTPLFCACSAGRTGAVRALLAVNANVEATRHGNNNTPLFAACCNGHLEVVRILLETGLANINAANIYGTQPLCIALKQGHKGVAEELRARGAGFFFAEGAELGKANLRDLGISEAGGAGVKEGGGGGACPS
jgi:ankyrin repeat protein